MKLENMYDTREVVAIYDIKDPKHPELIGLFDYANEAEAVAKYQKETGYTEDEMDDYVCETIYRLNEYLLN